MDYRQPEVTQVSEADFFAFQWEHHIWSTFKKSYITPPACAAFVVEQTNELLLHFTSAVRTDSLAGSHKSLLELGNNFIGGHTAGKQLFQYGFCFSLFGFFCGLFFGSNLFCLCFRKFLCCNVLRAKGFVQDENGWAELNATADGLTANAIPKRQEVLIVIGEGLEKERIEVRLKG